VVSLHHKHLQEMLMSDARDIVGAVDEIVKKEKCIKV
jgi:hypothetical protein